MLLQDRSKGKVIGKADAVLMLIFITAFVALYWKDISIMVSDWYNDPNYSHGFLIPFVSGYFVWQKRDTLKQAALKSSRAGLAVVVAGLLLYLAGTLSGELFSMKLSMLIVLAGSVLYVFGSEVFRIVLFPLGYLVFMIPLPYLLYDSIAFPLKLFVSKYSVDFLSAVGVLALREGNIIHLADITLEVADACSGIRSIISLLAMSTALAYVSGTGWLGRAVLVFFAIPVAIVVNALRVVGTGILAERYGSDIAQGFYHEFAGLVIFGVAIAILIVAAVLLRKIEDKSH
jgi:exosortase